MEAIFSGTWKLSPPEPLQPEVSFGLQTDPSVGASMPASAVEAEEPSGTFAECEPESSVQPLPLSLFASGQPEEAPIEMVEFSGPSAESEPAPEPESSEPLSALSLYVSPAQPKKAAVEAEHFSGPLPEPEPSGPSMSTSPAQLEMTAVEAAEPTSPSVLITPPSAESKRKYDRDFLLSLQFMPQCLQKPEGLPNYPVILDKANECQLPMCPVDWPTKSRGQKSGCKKRRQAPGCKRISVQLDCDVELNRSANAWKPGLKLAVEDPEALKTEITVKDPKQGRKDIMEAIFSGTWKLSPPEPLQPEVSFGLQTDPSVEASMPASAVEAEEPSGPSAEREPESSVQHLPLSLFTSGQPEEAPIEVVEFSGPSVESEPAPEPECSEPLSALSLYVSPTQPVKAAVEAEHFSGPLPEPEPSGPSMSTSPAQPEMTARARGNMIEISS
ncbi:eukaryotic translation initiation factor 4 gamma 1-like [Xyrauchen texanus]|uniref:eukaryotic translation initiation factor 4 gamma 1-like n=1 Tax=Xyrauchen texanus TaxID=154827 RepID=UPI002241F6EF|nr:eukaryotic translation initiation factor 4 gamma 1-like [Xyrauchen texanus]